MDQAVTTPIAASLGRLEAADAARARLLFSDRLARALGRLVPGLTLRAAAGPESPARSMEQGLDSFAVVLQGPDVELGLRFPAAIDPVAAAIVSAGAWSPTVQLTCLCARARVALAPLFEWVATMGLRPCELRVAPKPLTAPPGATRFECRVGHHPIDGWLRHADARWIARAEAAVATVAEPDLGRAAGVRVPVRAVLGQRRLSLGLIRSIEVGDVVLMDVPGRSSAEFTASLIAGFRGRAAVARACSVRAHELTTAGDGWMSSETTQARTAGARDARHKLAADSRREDADPMGDLEVDLHLELQVLSTPLAELASMRQGYVLELPVPAAEACVDLVVQGQVIGRAQLVSVGDRLGARILQLFDSDV